MFYLMMHSTHIYLRLYGVTHMVKDNSDSDKGNPLPPHGLLFPISSKGSFICINPDRITHTTVFVTRGARCSSVVRAFAHGATGRQIDPSWGEPIELFLVPSSAP